MKKALCIVLILTILGEFINVPFIELNQLAFLLFFPYFLFSIKNNHEKIKDANCWIIIVNCLIIFYLLIQGFLMCIDLNNFLVNIRNYIIVFLFINIVVNLNEEQYIYILKIIVWFATLMYLVEYIMWKFSLPMYHIFFEAPYNGIRHIANFLSPNSYAIVLGFLIIYHLDSYVNQKNKINALIMILLFLPLFTTYSKSGLIITIFGLLTYLFLSKKFPIKAGVIFFVIIGIWFILSGKLISVLMNYTKSYYVRRFILYLQTNNILGARSADYQEFICLLKGNWFTGVGFGNITGDNYLYQGGTTSVHNEYLRFILEGGITGGLLFLILVLLILREIWLGYKNKFNISNQRLLITFSLNFLFAEIFYNYFNAPREGMLLAFFAFGLFTCNTYTIDKSKNDY